MMNNKVNEDAQLKRMKALMNYGINESKQPEYSTVEYGKVAADGKLYGIVREGTNYFIKVAKNANAGLVSENFDYINGFRNRNGNKFNSFASAQRFFGEKLASINEATDNIQKRVITEAWDLQGKKDMIEEQTKKVQDEIARQRQIMENVIRISESKEQKYGKGKCQKCGSDPCKCSDMEGCKKPDTLKVKEVKGGPGAPFTDTLKNSDLTSNEKTNIKGGKRAPVKESTEVPLSSRENPDYMDKSHGTKIGKNAPFADDVENIEGAVADAEGGESVNEGATLFQNNQNTPKPGVDGEDDADASPFDETAVVTEAIDDLDDDLDDDVDIEDDFDDEDIDDADDDVDIDVDDEDIDDEDGENEYELELNDEDDIDVRMDNLEAKLDSILDAINDMKYDDDEELYADDNAEGEEDANSEDDFDDEEDEDITVVESKSYRAMKHRMLKEEDDFGKHPAYQKKVMTLPNNNNFKRDGQYDMNDDSLDGEKPFGINKGTQAPFEDSVEQIENAIVESVYNILKKKL